jgi:hypothetical protein
MPDPALWTGPPFFCLLDVLSYGSPMPRCPNCYLLLLFDPFSGSAHRHLIAGFLSSPSPGDDGATNTMRRCDGGWWWCQNTMMMPQWCHDAPSGCWWCWSWVILIYPTLIDMALLAVLGLGWNFGLLVILDLFDLFSLSLVCSNHIFLLFLPLLPDRDLFLPDMSCIFHLQSIENGHLFKK